jgi:hypothetical protein
MASEGLPSKALFVLWFVIIMAIYRYKSIANILMLLIMALREIVPTLSLLPVTKEAIIHAGKRLGIEPLKEMFELLSKNMKVKPTFHGYRVWAMDEVHCTLADTVENEAAFGRPGTGRSTARFRRCRPQPLSLQQLTRFVIAVFPLQHIGTQWRSPSS